MRHGNIQSRNKGRGITTLWLLWSLGSVGLCGALAFVMFGDAEKTVFMPGPLSNGHHQLAESCDSCHTDAFGSSEVLQESCIGCHGDDRKKPYDSHPIAKFKDPRNAARLKKINATQCVSCHVEHRPEITLANGLTRPKDVCFHCHEDIGTDRPSHEDMAFVDCTTSGCHNYHDNRALYTDFLVKHMDQADLLDVRTVEVLDFLSVIDQIVEYPIDDYPVAALLKTDADAPAELIVDDQLTVDWLTTSHAQSGVNCSGCHQPVDAEGTRAEWSNKPSLDGCKACHSDEVNSFTKGKHGMRLASGLTPMTPEKAKLPMQRAKAHEELTCSSCHGAHRFDTQQAAVESCLGCHADDHSLAYKESAHYALWQAEVNENSPSQSGVSCATCHMPRVDKDVSDWLSRVVVEHNQSKYFAPNSKMIRPVCQACHGLPFSINALADQSLITNNFNGQPSVHVDSVDLARQDADRHAQKKSKGQ